MTLLRKKVLQRTNRFARDLKPLPEHVKAEAFEAAQKLCKNIYDEEAIYLRRIAHRKEIYRNLEL
jgi:mRNA-degrading endonuclease RelE of RelBE toxin-antitoxin system